ncbi:metal-dependent hydrolase family protein [Brevibacillus marinus]|uniref:metal-dependent hydrolase family protein n=1 Tax=Brevibacillus marinus TaxID=2496837 RepID=UPI000F8224BB|nr:amidohydrolase family protein [Brevibacillus marinus]
MRTIFTNCKLIDGIVNDIIDNAFIIVEGEEIKEVGIGTIQPLPTDRVIDCSGKYVLPGLIDCHVHLVWDGSPDPQRVIQQLDQESVALRAYKHATEYLHLGITTVRDVASPNRSVLSVRNAINQKILVGPTIIASGPAICMTGGHVHYIGLEADGADEVRKAARKLLKEGVDLIKVMATGGIYTFGEEPGSPQLTKEELTAAKEEAHKKNKKVAAHAEGLKGIKNCIEVGIDTIEHGIFADEEALISMREKGIILVPTMVVMKRLAVDERIAPWALEKAKRVVEPHQKMLEQAIKIGVKIATGTDCGSPVTPPEFYFDELLIMEKAGMSAMEVIQASTRVAAECLGLDDRGVISEGKKADFLIVEQNPLDNLAVLRGQKTVVKDGAVISK